MKKTKGHSRDSHHSCGLKESYDKDWKIKTNMTMHLNPKIILFYWKFQLTVRRLKYMFEEKYGAVNQSSSDKVSDIFFNYRIYRKACLVKLVFDLKQPIYWHFVSYREQNLTKHAIQYLLLLMRKDNIKMRSGFSGHLVYDFDLEWEINAKLPRKI